jgi:hypothetical protein
MIEGLINGYSLSPLEIDYIHIVHGGDHGKNKFHFASKVILCRKNGESYSQVFGWLMWLAKKITQLFLIRLACHLSWRG